MPDKQILQGANILLVSDVVAAAAYYRDSLGFDYDRFWGEPPAFCMSWRDGHCIMLSLAADAGAIRPVGTVAPSVWDAYYWVKDVDALFADFRSRGAKIDYEPFVKPYGVKEGAVLDLDGYQLAFGQDLEP